MQLLITLLGLIGLLSTAVNATALTYRFHPNEKACFYAHNKEKGAKIAFYFAVQSGGSFDIDFKVTAPSKKTVLDGAKERQGDFVFTGNEIGEYSFCFDNEMSTVTDKAVDFEIAIEHEARAQLPSRQGAPAEQTSVVSESIYKLSGQLSTITRNQKYFRTRENRNFSTVRSTEQRIYRFSIMEVLVMVALGGLQVFVVRFFFTGARKGMLDISFRLSLLFCIYPIARVLLVGFNVSNMALARPQGTSKYVLKAIQHLVWFTFSLIKHFLNLSQFIANKLVRALFLGVSFVIWVYCTFRGWAFNQEDLKAPFMALLFFLVAMLVGNQLVNNPLLGPVRRRVFGLGNHFFGRV